jgi:hypothetical protein
MKRKIKLSVAGEQITLEWDGMFHGYAVNLSRQEGRTYEGESIPALYFLGRVGRHQRADGRLCWGNDRTGWVTDEVLCGTIEAAAERMILMFHRRHPRAN